MRSSAVDKVWFSACFVDLLGAVFPPAASAQAGLHSTDASKQMELEWHF